MGGTHSQKNLLVHELNLRNLRVPQRNRGQGKVQLAGKQLLLEHFGAIEKLGNLKGAVPMIGKIAHQQRVEQVRHRAANGDGGAGGGFVGVDDPLPFIQTVEGTGNLTVELLTNGGETDPALFALKQGYAKAGFQLGNGLRQRRLRHMKRFGCTGHILFFRNDLKIIQIS